MWTVHHEHAELFRNQPAQPIGWVLIDEEGRRYTSQTVGVDDHGSELRGTWITLDERAAHAMADELNATR